MISIEPPIPMFQPSKLNHVKSRRYSMMGMESNPVSATSTPQHRVLKNSASFCINRAAPTSPCIRETSADDSKLNMLTKTNGQKSTCDSASAIYDYNSIYSNQSIQKKQRPVPQLAEEQHSDVENIENVVRRVGSCRVARDNNNKIAELLNARNSITSGGSCRSKPTPPHRTSSLLYNRVTSPGAASFIMPVDESSSLETNSDRNSIYSTYSLRYNPQMSLTRDYSSFSLSGNTSNEMCSNNYRINELESFRSPLAPPPTDTVRIESCYQSIGSSVFACKCQADLYLTNFDGLVRLLDWTHETNGVPVWVFNTGQNPKREKGLSLVMADRATGFAFWQITSITHLNDFKWTKPGHVTFKIFANNMDSPIHQTRSASFQGAKSGRQRPLSLSSTMSNMSVMLNVPNASSISHNFQTLNRAQQGTTKTGTATIKRSNSSLSSSSTQSHRSGGPAPSLATSAYLFAAIKFQSDFECSRFYDFYRHLFSDSANDDLFNPHFKQPKTTKINQVTRFLYKKISKNCISSPCAFQHINSLSMVSEETASLPPPPAASASCLVLTGTAASETTESTSSDTQSMKSELTVTSHNNSSILLANESKRNKK